jgi:hypothetical protein
LYKVYQGEQPVGVIKEDPLRSTPWEDTKEDTLEDTTDDTLDDTWRIPTPPVDAFSRHPWRTDTLQELFLEKKHLFVALGCPPW